MNPTTGDIVWINSCYGDTYATLPLGRVLYSVGHVHDCSEIGAFPNATAPGAQDGAWHRPTAETTYATGGVNGAGTRGASWSFAGYPDAGVLDWFPAQTRAQPTPAAENAIAPGTVSVSGAAETGWDLSSDGNYLVVGGEMTSAGDPGSVSYLPHQQGLVRYAVHSLAPNKVGPFFNSVIAPTAAAGAKVGLATVSWTAAWDRDNQNLTYGLYRDAALVYTTTLASTFWQTPRVNYTDTNLTAGTHTYQIKVTDPDGNWVKTALATVAITNGGTTPAPLPGANLALNRTTSNSGFWAAGYDPANAVNGNLSDVGLAGAILAVANNGPNSWWQVDLGTTQPVSRVVVNGRIDCCSDQSANYWVLASNTPFDTRLTPEEQARQPGVWSYHQVAAAGRGATATLPAGTTARYVLIQHGSSSPDYLSLIEVQVFGPQ